MSIVYAGQSLLAPTAAAIAALEASIDPDAVLDYELRHWPGRLRPNSWPIGTPTRTPFRINSLYWPVSASRWALGRFLAEEARVESLRDALYPDSASYASATFSLDDGRDVGSIETPLYMLPPRPLYQFAGSEAPRSWYLITLVDDRFFWWERSGTITVTEDTTTWAQLYAAIAALLGITLTVDTVDADYGKPPGTLSAVNPPLPILLDSVARAVGQRIVRQLDGTVLAQGVAAAKVTVAANRAASSPKFAGGLFQLQLSE